MTVSVGNFESARRRLRCGVPQGSVLWTILFNVYMLPPAQILEYHNNSYRACIDDTPIPLNIVPNTH